MQARLAVLAGRSREQVEFSLEPVEALWLLSSFCNLYQRSFDAELLARECVPPMTLADVTRLAELIGLTAAPVEVRAGSLSSVRHALAVRLAPAEVAAAGAAVSPDAASAASPLPQQGTEWLIVLK